MSTESVVYIGLGANLYDPVQKIFDATYCFQSNGKIRLSSIYLTSPVGFEQQPDFINVALELKTLLSPEELLDECQVIESQMGRIRDESNQNAARIIDCDILLYEDKSIKTKTLTIPHPRLSERLFVLEPLCELNESLIVPGLGTVKQLLKQCDRSEQVVTKLT